MSRAKSTGALGPPRRRLTQQTSFQDYAGNPAVSVWHYTEGSLKEIPFSYQVYITTGDSHNHTSSTLPSDLLDTLTKYQYEPEMWRLDLYFLPLADADASMEHYQREKVHRQGADMHTVPSDEGMDCYHHNVLFIIDDERCKETELGIIKFGMIDFEDDPDDPLGILERTGSRRSRGLQPLCAISGRVVD